MLRFWQLILNIYNLYVFGEKFGVIANCPVLFIKCISPLTESLTFIENLP